MKRSSIRVFLVEDNPLYLDSLSEILRMEDGLEVVGSAGDGERAEELIASLSPDVVLMDLRLPGRSGQEVTQRISRRCPAVRIVGLSICDEPETASGLLGDGARAFVQKDAPAEEIIKKIREVHEQPLPAPSPPRPPPPATEPF